MTDDKDRVENEASKDEPEEGTQPAEAAQTFGSAKKAKEIGGPKGPEPTRFGDWERNGRCYDF